MANLNAPFGFKPVRSIDGSPFNNKIQLCWVPSSDATALGINDLVKLAASVNDVNSYGVPVVTAVSANTDVVYGSVISVEPVIGMNPPNLYNQYRLASTGQYVYVVNATDTVFQVQAFSTTNVADIGKNGNWKAGSITTANGLSGATLDSPNIATTNTFQFQIISVAQIPGQLGLGNNYVIYEVINNKAQLANQATGV